jgi:hypothetical protein
MPPLPTLPPPWKRLFLHVGGITEIGYARDSDLLLVISTAGRGVYDCLTGERLAHRVVPPYDYDSWWFPTKLEALGIGPLENQAIRIAGLCGGGLPYHSSDNWSIKVSNYISEKKYSSSEVTLVQPHKPTNEVTPFSTVVYENDICEFRAAGFSETGRSFVCASSCDLVIFYR